MKIKIIGKAHREGISSKTGRPYNINTIHYTGAAKDVEGLAAMSMTLDGVEYPYNSIAVNTDYVADFDGNGTLLSLSPIGGKDTSQTR